MLLPVLAGASPASTGRGPTLDALRAAVGRSGVEPSTIAELRAVAGAELDAFLAEHGWRLVTGYDIDSLALGELPALVVNLARPVSDPVDAGTGAEEALDVVAQKVGDANRAELARLVSDARATVGLRDDNGAVTAAWPAGLLRRAMLAAGRVLVARGDLALVEHAIEVTVDELIDMLEGDEPTGCRHRVDACGRSGPSDRRWCRRSSSGRRRTSRSRRCRSRCGPWPGHSSPFERSPRRPSARAPVLDGDGIGSAVYRGRACVAAEPGEALDRLEPGDVLVAFGTTPAYNMVLSIAGAVVVEEGGLFSHAAVIARELGLSAVIGAARAMTEIPDGSLVEVDPVAGRVRVIEPYGLGD